MDYFIVTVQLTAERRDRITTPFAPVTKEDLGGCNSAFLSIVFLLLFFVVWIFLIKFPSYRIVDNIFPDLIQFFFITYYTFIIITLPHRHTNGITYPVDYFSLRRGGVTPPPPLQLSSTNIIPCM